MQWPGFVRHQPRLCFKLRCLVLMVRDTEHASGSFMHLQQRTTQRRYAVMHRSKLWPQDSVDFSLSTRSHSRRQKVGSDSHLCQKRLWQWTSMDPRQSNRISFKELSRSHSASAHRKTFPRPFQPLSCDSNCPTTNPARRAKMNCWQTIWGNETCATPWVIYAFAFACHWRMLCTYRRDFTRLCVLAVAGTSTSMLDNRSGRIPPSTIQHQPLIQQQMIMSRQIHGFLGWVISLYYVFLV